MKPTKQTQTGFTLVELIVVIVILGILAATALPRFISVTAEARGAALDGLGGGLRSAVAVAQARYFATGGTDEDGATAGTQVRMADGTFVTVGTAGAAMGVPVSTAAGIGNAMKSTEGFAAPIYAAPTTTYNFPTAIVGCNVVYTATAGTVVVNKVVGTCS